MPTSKSKSSADPLVGRFFHSVRLEPQPNGKEKKTIEWQGRVIGTPQPGYYLVQLFDWLMGEPQVQRLVRIEEMLGWQFYDADEDMKSEWDRVREKLS